MINEIIIGLAGLILSALAYFAWVWRTKDRDRRVDKKSCMKEKQRTIPMPSWTGKDGFHCMIPDASLSQEQIEEMTKEYQKQI